MKLGVALVVDESAELATAEDVGAAMAHV
jgi:hypothetical protein